MKIFYSLLLFAPVLFFNILKSMNNENPNQDFIVLNIKHPHAELLEHLTEISNNIKEIDSNIQLLKQNIEQPQQIYPQHESYSCFACCFSSKNPFLKWWTHVKKQYKSE